MRTTQFSFWLDAFKKQADLLNERRLVVLSGEEAWALSLLADFIAFGPLDNESTNSQKAVERQCLIYGDSLLFPANVSLKRFRDKLGSESDCIVFADSQFNIDALAALSGTLKAGGILFIIMPEFEKKIKQSYFVKRFFNILAMMPEHALINEFCNKSIPLVSQHKHDEINRQVNNDEILAYSCLSSEQVEAVNAIKKVVNGHRKRPLVLTADRGRGKSSALAIACAQLLRLGKEGNQQRIIITAPDRQSLSVFFHQLAVSLPEAVHDLDHCTYQHGTVEYIAIDQVIKCQPKSSLLLVDEAAGIPVYLLEQLLNCYHRVVFSSTVHGYEGAGRGFTLKFQKTLDNACPNWRALHINKPIRWREGDPLERLIFDTCLLNSELISIELDNSFSEQSGFDISTLCCRVINVKELMQDESLLRQVFSILVTAHYQTKPSDVKLMLDNPKVTLICVFESKNNAVNNKVLAVALLLNEGATSTQGDSNLNEITINDIEAVQHSKRRLKNQFLPQSLLSHCGFDEAFNYHYLRIMRIAVHAQLQKQGIGQYLLKHIEQLGNKQDVDFIGASFGVNASLLSFWLSSGMHVLRIGFTKDKASGEHSVMVLKALNSKAKVPLLKFNDEFYRGFDYLLSEEYKELSPELVLLLLKQQVSSKLAEVTLTDMSNVEAFAVGQRLYSNCAYSLYLWFKHQLLTQANIETEQIHLVCISRLLQRHSIDKVCKRYGYTGKNKLEAALKNYVKQQLAIK